MAEKEPNGPIQRYLHSATPEGQKAFGAALAGRKKSMPAAVSGSMIMASRWLSLGIAISYLLSSGWSAETLQAMAFLVLLGAVAWFPNEAAEATGRIGLGSAVSRRSHPWILFVLVWVFLAVFGSLSVVQWMGGVT